MHVQIVLGPFVLRFSFDWTSPIESGEEYTDISQEHPLGFSMEEE